MSKQRELTPFGQRKYTLGPISGLIASLIGVIVVPTAVICLGLVGVALVACGMIRGCESITPKYVGQPVPSASVSAEPRANYFQTWNCDIIREDLKHRDPELRRIARLNWKSYECDSLPNPSPQSSGK